MNLNPLRVVEEFFAYAKTNNKKKSKRIEAILLSIISSFFNRGSALLLTIFGVSLTLPYLEVERFGIWMTLTSLSMVFGFLDFGISNSLVSRISKISSTGHKKKIVNVISGSIGSVLCLSMIVLAFLLTVNQFIPWEFLIKVNNVYLYTELHNSVLFFLVLFSLNIFSAGIQKIFIGMQKTHYVNIILGIFNLISLLILKQLAECKAGIPILLVVTMSAPIFTSFCLLLILQIKNFVFFKLIFSNSIREAKENISLGSLFFLVQIGTIAAWGGDYLLISSVLGPSNVAIYNVVQRVFFVVTQPLLILNSPLWTAYSDAHHSNDKYFIKSTLKFSLVITFFSIVIFGGLISFFADTIINFWTGSRIYAPSIVIFSFYIWTILDVCGNCFAMFLNGCNEIKPQIVTTFLLCVFSIPMKIYFSINYGLSGMLIAGSVCYSLITFLVYGILYRKILSQFTSHEKK